MPVMSSRNAFRILTYYTRVQIEWGGGFHLIITKLWELHRFRYILMLYFISREGMDEAESKACNKMVLRAVKQQLTQRGTCVRVPDFIKIISNNWSIRKWMTGIHMQRQRNWFFPKRVGRGGQAQNFIEYFFRNGGGTYDCARKYLYCSSHYSSAKYH